MHEGTTVRQNTRNYLPNNRASHPRRLERVATPVWQLQMAQLFVSYRTKEVLEFQVYFHSNRSETVISSNGSKISWFQYFMQKPGKM
jgi:hypothetical protein